MNDPIAYVYEADHHCECCAEKRFGRTERDGYDFIAEGAIDSEGNEVGIVAPWDDWYANDVYEGRNTATLTCGTCLEVIETIDLKGE